MNMFENNKK